MNYSIVLTETAQADLSAIYRYIAVDLQSVQNASGQLSRIEKAVASLI
jgi:toxin ParE1/3/4